jgi:hypothetical protein
MAPCESRFNKTCETMCAARPTTTSRPKLKAMRHADPPSRLSVTLIRAISNALMAPLMTPAMTAMMRTRREACTNRPSSFITVDSFVRDGSWAGGVRH